MPSIPEHLRVVNPADPLRRGRRARWWTSHGGMLLHEWWCRYLETAPGRRPEPDMDHIDAGTMAARVPRRRRCGWCCAPEG